MKDSARYAKVVEWSDNDHCYIPLPPPTSGRDFVNKMQNLA